MIKLRVSAAPDLYTETDAVVFGDWAVHFVQGDGFIFYRVTHVPTGYAMPERLIGYLGELDAIAVAQRLATDCSAFPKDPNAEDGAQWAWIFEAVAAEAVAS